jgi:hypothetical protein
MQQASKLLVFFGLFASLAFFSCSEKQTGTWVSNDLASQTYMIKFDGSDVLVQTIAVGIQDSMPTDYKRLYSIEDKIVSDSNSTECLYIVKRKEGQHPNYSVIGEVSIDDKTRKFYIKYLDIVRYDSKQQIMDKLNRQMFGTTGKYLVYRDARKGDVYTKEAPGKH